MRLAIISDIHANLQAWKAVLLDIRSNAVDRIICLGDIVGYGPHPAEVLQAVHENVDHIVLGNHDAVISGKLDPQLFNENARKIIYWTRDKLNRQAVKFLRSLPLSLDAGDFRCTHGDFSDPAAFNYVIEPEDAMASWKVRAGPLMFVGHTHRPRIFVLGSSGTPRDVEPQDFALEPEKRFLVNVGSVGQPRDGEARACYCIYDTQARSVFWRRIPFDIDAYREALERAGLPSKPSYFLQHDPRKATPPLRELLNFSPPSAAEHKVRDTVEVQDVNLLAKKVRQWKLLTALIVLLAASAISLSAVAWWRYHNRGLVIAEAVLSPIDATSVQADQDVLPALASPTLPGSPLSGWEVHLGNKRRQSIHVEDIDGAPVVVMTSSTDADELRLVSPPVRVQPGMKCYRQALCRKGGRFHGTLSAVVSLEKMLDGEPVAVDQFLVKEPNEPRQDGWALARNTFDLPAGSRELRYELRGRFTGQVLVRDMVLCRKD